MFVRLKKIQGKYYAYNSENRRVYGKVKQKTKSYIGKAIIPKHKKSEAFLCPENSKNFQGKTKNIGFFEFAKQDPDQFITNKTIKQIVEELIRWEIFRHDLKDIKLDINNYSLTMNNKPIVLKINEGYLYNKTIKDIINFHAVGDDEYFIGKEFAETFVKAGIEIPKELFVRLFEKITKK